MSEQLEELRQINTKLELVIELLQKIVKGIENVHSELMDISTKD